MSLLLTHYELFVLNGKNGLASSSLHLIRAIFQMPRYFQGLFQAHLYGGGVLPRSTILRRLAISRCGPSLFATRELRLNFGFDVSTTNRDR
jgi:hypothetical protein